MPKEPSNHTDDVPHPYAGRWIARLEDRVVGQGGTPDQALKAAQAARFKEKPEISYMPTKNELDFSPYLEQVSSDLPKKSTAYLTGGAVRDALLQKAFDDLDFTTTGDALKLARKVANSLGGAYYRLDDETQSGRVVLTQEDGSRNILDFTKLRAADLENDLLGRDFTINAMAVDIRNPRALLDPLGGMNDLIAKRLRACSDTAFKDDPVRILRAVRFAAAYELHIVPETRKLMRKAVGNLPQVSPERLRDELFRILSSPRPAASLRALEVLGVLPHILPELTDLKSVSQSAPHVYDVWEHTLHTLENLEVILASLAEEYDHDTARNLSSGLIVVRLGRFRKQISEHLKTELNRDRSLRALLFLAVLYHDSGKPETQTIDASGKIRFLEHERIGADIIAQRAKALRLSNPERDRLITILAQHMRPFHLAQTGEAPTRKAVYRFFHATDKAGVDICLLSLADLMATYANTLPPDTLQNQLGVVRVLLEAYWEKPEQSVSPAPLLDGKDLIKEFKIKPGPLVGQLLEVIRETQAAGEIKSRDEAKKFVRYWIEKQGG
ncbi:MAG: HD domain-containing protein [Chloroflexi bacterium]|nr:HD domain-containing protein [Chloroflexota bacterium]